MADFSYEVQKHIGVISTSKNGWQKELNLVSYNGREAKYDIREWDPERTKMSKGITLTKEELKTLADLIKEEI